MPAGKYRVAIGIMANDTQEPAVQLAIAGKTAAGWRPMGRMDGARWGEWILSRSLNLNQ